jgi:predicted transposase/invertase (TIGR01784 family)
MNYLDPKWDIAFKKLFGSAVHKNLLISFLNGVLNRAEGEKIVDLVYNDPYNHPETFDAKLSIVDVRCTDQQGKQYLVEMQVDAQKYYAERAQYYVASALNRQLKKGSRYTELMPVIFVGILNENLFSTSRYMSHHLFLDDYDHQQSLKLSEFYFIELKKFNKTVDQLETIFEKWVYFFKYAETLDQVPKNLKEPELREAFDLMAEVNWSEKERAVYEKLVDEERSKLDREDWVKEKAEAIGEKKKAHDIAMRLLGKLPLEEIAQVTGLTLEEIKSLKSK